MIDVSLRPRMIFRVGVTGHRSVPEDSARVSADVDACLALLSAEIERIAKSQQNRGAYADPQPGERRSGLRIVSPLAIGADRIVARAALKFDAELYAPLPFSRDDYLQDFPNTDQRRDADAFAELISDANLFELDGARVSEAAKNESYEAIGRYVVRNCDLLIAIWDGKPERGQGGAGEIVSFAVRAGVWVWWIDASEKAKPRLIRNFADYHALAHSPADEAAERALRGYLQSELPPPAVDSPEREGVIGRLAEFWRVKFAPDRTPLEEFYAEPQRPPRQLWRIYGWFKAVLNMSHPADFAALFPGTAKPGAAPPVGAWDALFQTADRASEDYGNRYRSSYVWVAMLAIVAQTFAAIGGDVNDLQKALVVVEILALLAIFALVLVNDAWRWHERWISYRLLAELARKQRVLALIGQSLPGADVHLLASRPEVHRVSEMENPPRGAWVAWLFMAHRRANPPPTGAMAQAKSDALGAARAMVKEQIGYHETRRTRSRRAGASVRFISEVFFFATIAVAIAKAGFILAGDRAPIHWLVLAAALASSIATAFVGMRAYAEFGLLVRQSTYMVHALKTAQGELDSLVPIVGIAQSSLQIGRTLYATTTTMMQDITGWAHLFRIKALETM